MTPKMKHFARIAEICRMSALSSEADDDSLERFARLIIQQSVDFLHDINADFEADQLDDFWKI